ncbi:MAG: TolC family protein [Limisphaerales bacterium]
MKKSLGLGLFLAGTLLAQGADTNSLAWVSRPLPLTDCLNLALQQNATILKAKNDLEASHGIVVQTRAVALPQLNASSQFKSTDPDAIESFPGTTSSPHQNWNAGVQIVQSIYEGGRLGAALRAAGATKQQALAQYQTVISDTLLNTRIAYYDVLLAAQQITVHEASVNLLQRNWKTSSTVMMPAPCRSSTCFAPKWPWRTNVPS